MRRFAFAPVLVLLAACQPAPQGVDGQRLSDEVARAVGDPETCVLIVEKASGKTVFQYGQPSRCARGLPSCEGGKLMSAQDLAKLAAKGDDRAISCDSTPDGFRSVAWASGPVTPSPGSKYGPLAYAAVMEGETALPGREIKARLEPALKHGGM